MDIPQHRVGTVVVGVDGSPSADLALDWAARQAALDHRPLTLVHATSIEQRFWSDLRFAGRDDVLDAVSDSAHTLLDEASARAGAAHPGLVVHQVVSEADAREALLALAGDAVMIVVGSRGRGPVSSLLLGSVSIAVSKLAGCPVVVVRPEDPAVTRHGVVVGVDGAASSGPAVEFAYRLASTGGWPLTLLQCFADDRTDPHATDLDQGEDDDEGQHRLLANAVEGWSAKFPDVAVEMRMQHGFLDQRLVELSASMDVVVVGAVPSNRLSDLVYGSLAPTVVEHAQGVVAVVPLAAVAAGDR